jgi:hypothetical protein
MKVADFAQFKIESEMLRNIKGGEIWCSVNVGFPDGSGFVNIGQCSGPSISACQSTQDAQSPTFGDGLCSTYTGIGATSCSVICT